MEETKDIKRLIEENKVEIALSKIKEILTTFQVKGKEDEFDLNFLETTLANFISRNNQIQVEQKRQSIKKDALDAKRNNLNTSIFSFVNNDLEGFLLKENNKVIVKSVHRLRVLSVLSLLLFLTLVYFLLINYKNRTKSFLLSPNGGENSPWISSKIYVNKGDKIFIDASGKINLALHYVVDQAFKDTVQLKHEWNSPLGLEEISNINNAITDLNRNQYRLKMCEVGRLIWVIAEEEPVEIVDKDLIEDYNENREYYICNNSGYLWFTVNDVWIYQEYFDSLTASDFSLPIETWNYLKQDRIHNIWFNDNGGNFYIEVKKK